LQWTQNHEQPFAHVLESKESRKTNIGFGRLKYYRFFGPTTQKQRTKRHSTRLRNLLNGLHGISKTSRRKDGAEYCLYMEGCQKYLLSGFNQLVAPLVVELRIYVDIYYANRGQKIMFLSKRLKCPYVYGGLKQLTKWRRQKKKLKNLFV
jgi:hypothetical protein